MSLVDTVARQFADLSAAERALLDDLGRDDRPAGPIRPAGPQTEARGPVLAAALLALEQDGRRGRSVHLDGWRIDGSLALDDLELRRRVVFDGCEFAAPFSADCAHLAGLEFRNCTLAAGLSAREARVEADLALLACKVTGAVALESIRIDGDFDCRRTVLRQGAAPTVETGDDEGNKRREQYRRDELVNLVGAHVAGRVRFDNISCDGRLRLTNIRVGGDVDCWNAGFVANGDEENGLILTNAAVEEKIIITKLKVTPRTVLKFDYSRARLFQGDADEESWPQTGRLGLEGFSFDFVAFMARRQTPDRPDNKVISAEVAIAWLERLGPLFHRQPYMQIARVFRDQGYLNESIEVLIAQEEGDRRRRTERLLLRLRDGGEARRTAAVLASATLAVARCLNPWRYMRYGYRPLNAVYVLAALFVIGAVLFGEGHSRSLIVPARDSVYLSDRYDPAIGIKDPVVYPEFNPWLYSLDTLVPVFQLGQEEHWQPNARTDFSGAIMTPDAPDPWHERPFRAGALLSGYLYFFHIPMGWLFSVLFFAGISRRLQVG
ncbi:MAG: hypothetical protein AB7F36_05675 [Reyranellaceae bacterium]